MPTPTDEQQAAIDGFATGRNITIEAAAGAGKTSTLRFLADVNPSRSGLYIAFNKSVQLEAETKFAGTSIQARTAHSLAFRALDADLRHKLNDKAKMRSAEQAEIIGLRHHLAAGRDADNLVRQGVAMRLVRDTIKAFCRTSAEEIAPEMVPVPPAMQLDDASARDLQEQVYRYARKYWNNILDPNGRLPFQPDYYVKLWAMSNPTLPYDYILLDEAQDSDPSLIQVLAGQKQAQLVAVGDRSQAIYGWRGAVDSMDAFDGDVFQLTQSFRFGEAIAEEANVWLDLLDASLRVRGSDKPSSVHPSYGRVPEAVLCRSNAGVIGEIINAHKTGVTAAIAGTNRSNAVRALAEAAQSLIERGYTTHPELDTFKSWKDVQDFAENDHDGAELQPLVRVIDAYGADTIINAIDACVPVAQAETCIATVHVAKGLEWRHVRISDDFPIPSLDEFDQVEPLTEEAMMTAYVATTRAQRHLDNTGLEWVRGYRRALQRPEYGPDFQKFAHAKRSKINGNREAGDERSMEQFRGRQGRKSQDSTWSRGRQEQYSTSARYAS